MLILEKIFLVLLFLLVVSSFAETSYWGAARRTWEAITRILVWALALDVLGIILVGLFG